MRRAIWTGPISTVCAIVLLAGTGASSGCGDRSQGGHSDSDTSITEVPDPKTRNLAASSGTAIDEPLMIALALAKNFHHKADVYLRDAQFDKAIDSVQQILIIQFPDGAPEAEDVTLDARARLAKLLTAQGQIKRAMAVVDEGIDSAQRRSFFLANLYTAKGEAYEAMANMLDDEETDSAKAQARKARRDAIGALEQSIIINRELQRAILDRGTP